MKWRKVINVYNDKEDHALEINVVEEDKVYGKIEIVNRSKSRKGKYKYYKEMKTR